MLMLSIYVFVETSPKDLINHHNKYGKYICDADDGLCYSRLLFDFYRLFLWFVDKINSKIRCDQYSSFIGKRLRNIMLQISLERWSSC